MSTNKAIAKSASVISAFTLFSRLLGFVRDVVIARMFGVYLYAQAFVIAFRIPNLLRDLVAEGAANSAFVPVFSEYSIKRSREEFWELANILLNVMIVLLMVITILGVLAAPFIVRLIAPGFVESPQKLEATVRLTRILFPYILLIGLAAYATGILNSLKHFALPAFAPCLLNICLVLAVLFFGEGITGLAVGVLAGGLLQLAVQLPLLYKKGFRPKLFKSFRHPELPRVGRLMLPRFFSSGVYQLNNFADSIFGSLSGIVGEGGVAALYFSYRLIQFPLGIFSNALTQAILPALSTHALEDSNEKLKHSLSWGLRSVFFVLLPASFALLVLARPLILALFGGRRFDCYAAGLTSSALFFYSLGLSAYGASKVLQSAFFALKDTVTPAKVAGIALVVNIGLNAWLMFPLKIGGIALATSLSGINTFVILFLILRKRLGGIKGGEIINSFWRVFLACCGMGLVCYLVMIGCAGLNKFASLAITVISGISAYIIFCFVLRVPEMLKLWQWIREKI